MAYSLEPHIGQRISYRGSPGTIRYVGDIEGVKSIWLGVEWDDPTRGKHTGTHDNKVYFRCLDPHPTAASFIRVESKLDRPVGFMEALHKKYAPDDNSQALENSNRLVTEKPIQISGKIVEEVGFDKIRERQAILTELRTIILDGACIAGLGPEPWPLSKDLHDWERSHEDYTSRYGRLYMPAVRELDLSRNLLEVWMDVVGICVKLRLKILKLNGNRFRYLDIPHWLESSVIYAFRAIQELGLDNTLLTWDQVLDLTAPFHSLETLSIAANRLSNPIPTCLNNLALSTLNLSSNAFDCLSCLGSLASLPNLHTLILHGNEVSKLMCNMPVIIPPVFKSLINIDLSANAVSSFNFISHLPKSVPNLTSLRISQNPLFSNLSTEESYLLTLARISGLEVLNYSKISQADRMSAELYYLNRIGSELSAAPIAQAAAILADHPRYDELCSLHGPPAIKRDAATADHLANTLGARLIAFSFYYPAKEASDESTAKVGVMKALTRPRSINVYFLKAEVGRLFGIAPMHMRLVWETGEWDPAGRSLGPDDDDYWSVGSEEFDDEGVSITSSRQTDRPSEARELGGGVEDEHSYDLNNTRVEGNSDRREPEGDTRTTNDVDPSGAITDMPRDDGKEQGKWVRREVELLDGTRELGFWIEGREARVRVEYREKTY